MSALIITTPAAAAAVLLLPGDSDPLVGRRHLVALDLSGAGGDGGGLCQHPYPGDRGLVSASPAGVSLSSLWLPGVVLPADRCD